MNTPISILTVPASDPLTLARLRQPTAILDTTTIAEIEPEVTRAIVAASVPTTMSPRPLPLAVPAPRSARSHLALNLGGTL